MKNCPPEKLAFLATQIAIEISRGKDISQLNLIKTVVGQISCVLQTIICQRVNQDCDKKKH
ncbi:MAG: hypothetical protein ACI4L1_01480 [Christensenellales bacterium]